VAQRTDENGHPSDNDDHFLAAIDLVLGNSAAVTLRLRAITSGDTVMNMNVNPNTHTSTNNAEQSAHRKVDSAASSAHDAVDWAAEKASNAQDSLSETGHDLKEAQERWLAIAREYVRENPATSVGIAVASGYLLSRILRSS
jgi:ElaB/YqjD/DUF883 family membrane-anchored ribosome-binding protein